MTTKPFVKVTWHDAEDYRDSTWASEEEVGTFTTKPCPVVSFGYLVSKTKTHISLAADYAEPITWGRIIKIPKKMIIGSIETIDLTPKPVV